MFDVIQSIQNNQEALRQLVIGLPSVAQKGQQEEEGRDAEISHCQAVDAKG